MVTVSSSSASAAMASRRAERSEPLASIAFRASRQASSNTYNSLGGDAVPGCGLAGEGAVLVEIEEDNSLVLQRREGADDLFQLVPAREDGFRLGVVQAKRYFLREQLDGKGYRYAARVEHADFPQDPFRPPSARIARLSPLSKPLETSHAAKERERSRDSAKETEFQPESPFSRT